MSASARRVRRRRPVPAYQVWALPGMPEVRPGDDLAKLIDAATGADGARARRRRRAARHLEDREQGRGPDRAGRRPRGGDRRGDGAGGRAARARCGSSRTGTGFVMAAAGVDASNTPAGTVLLLPEDPDASARRDPRRAAGRARRRRRRRRHRHLRAALARRADRCRDRRGRRAGAGRSARRRRRVRQSARA